MAVVGEDEGIFSGGPFINVINVGLPIVFLYKQFYYQAHALLNEIYNCFKYRYILDWTLKQIAFSSSHTIHFNYPSVNKSLPNTGHKPINLIDP